MATELTMPKLGLTMVDGKVIEWRNKEGDIIEKGAILLVIETEKVTYEVEAPTSGVLGMIVVPEGETVSVGTVLAYILQQGEKLPEISLRSKEALKAVMTAQVASAAPISSIGQNSQSRIVIASIEKVKISPVAKKMAEEHDLDISKLIGTGPNGRIIQDDIRRAVEKAKSTPPHSQPTLEKIMSVQAKLLPLSGVRRTIARRMSQSFNTAPHFWVQARANATKLKEARELLLPTIETKTGQRLTYTDLVIKMVARALEDFPTVNSRWTDSGIELLEDINIGLATSISDGLIVPVIRQANKKMLAEITTIRSDIVQRGRAGKLGIDDMTGSTLTITNLGTAGIISVNPILNPPEAAILALGAITEEPSAVDGKIMTQLSLYMTLGIDHRALDGFIAAQFLGRMKELIEQPLLLLI